jgi:hypothetical protein
VEDVREDVEREFLSFKIYFLFILQKYTGISKFSKTNLLPPWPMAVGGKRPWATAGSGATVTYRRGSRRLSTVAPATGVAHGGQGQAVFKNHNFYMKSDGDKLYTKTCRFRQDLQLYSSNLFHLKSS